MVPCLVSLLASASATEPALDALANGRPKTAPDPAVLAADARRFSRRSALELGGAALALGGGLGVLAWRPAHPMELGTAVLDAKAVSGALLLIGGTTATFVGIRDINLSIELRRRSRVLLTPTAGPTPAGVGLAGTF